MVASSFLSRFILTCFHTQVTVTAVPVQCTNNFIVMQQTNFYGNRVVYLGAAGNAVGGAAVSRRQLLMLWI